MSALIRMGVLAGIGTLVYNLVRKKQLSGANSQAMPVFSSGVVRNAGPEEQSLRDDRGWDKVDEQIDESFPASDPPSTY